MSHDHHSHSVKNIKVVFFLNVSFTLIEFIGGFLTNSVAIMSDAVHDLGDSLSLGLSWYMQSISKKKRDSLFSYGYRRFSLLSALINSIVLTTGSGIIIFEAVPRLFNPETVNYEGMLILSILGIVFNGIAVLKMQEGKTMNEKVVSWHLLEDVMGWGAILLGSLAMMLWDLPVLDPILSVGISVFILLNVLKNLKSTLMIFLQSIPDSVDLDSVESQIKQLNFVNGIHDTHIWSLDGDYHVLSTHVVTTKLSDSQRMNLKSEIHKLVSKLNIKHATLEFETEEEHCQLKQC